METTTMDIVLQSIGYILLLVLLVLLWRKALRPSEARQVWILLALAWTMNLLGNIAWFVHDSVTGSALDTISVVDLFFGLRYALIGWALWLYPSPLSRRAWFWMGGTMLVVAAIAWMVYYDPATSLRGGGWADFLSLIMYLILDAGIVALAWLRFRAAQQSAWSNSAFLLFCAMASYAIANTINLTEYVFSRSGGTLQTILWDLTDVALLVMVLRPDLRKQELSES